MATEEDKSIEQLMNELAALRKHLSRLEATKTEPSQAGEPFLGSEVGFHSLGEDILNDFSIGIFVLDADFRIIWMNRVLEEFFNVKKEFLIGQDKRTFIEKRMANIFHDSEALTDKILSTYARDTHIETIECRVRAGDGRRERWLRHWSRPIRSGRHKGGRIEHYEDISERRRMEESLRESESKYHKLYDNMRDGVATLDLDGRIIECNRAFQDMLGYAPEEIQRSKNKDLTPLQWQAREAAIMENEVFTRGFSDVYEKEFIRKDGSLLPVELRAHRIDGRNGKAAGICVTVRNLTERKDMELELRQTKVHLEKVIENAVDAIGIVDRRGTFVLWNKRAEEIFGYSSSEIKGSHYAGIYTDPTELDGMLAILQKDGVIREYEMSVTKKDGVKVPMELSINLLKDDTGHTVGSVCVARDLSEKKLMEAQLLHAVKMEAVGTLSGGIAHDFNNLLQAIHGYAELLLMERKENDEGYAELKEIVRAARRGGELTRQLLTFSRKVHSNLRPVDLNHEIAQIATLLQRTIPKMIRIDLGLEDNIGAINADPNQIEQTLVNLAVNAKDAMPEGGILVIETKSITLDEEFCRTHPGMAPGDFVLLSVTDTGCGMDEETQKHIFDPFYTTKEVGKGTGLGLSTVYGIVKSHHGHITCESRLGAGTSFRIFLPVMNTVQAVGKTAPFPTSRGGTETILIVDDEAFILDLGKQILGRYGYTVLTASDAESAIGLYIRERGRIDLVILDLIMPGMGGKECLTKLLEIDPATKVLIVSGYSTRSHPLDPPETITSGFIRKPYRSSEILDAVRKALDEPKTN